MNAFLKAVEERIARERMEGLGARAREQRQVREDDFAVRERERVRRARARARPGPRTVPGAGTRFKVACGFRAYARAAEALRQCAPGYRKRLMQWAREHGHADAVRGVTL